MLHTELIGQAIPPRSLIGGYERRARPRISLVLPVVLSRPGEKHQIKTHTANVTCEGFLCVSDRPLAPGEVIECELLITGDTVSSVPEDDLKLSWRARVVRVVPSDSQVGYYQVACRVEEDSFTRSAA